MTYTHCAELCLVTQLCLTLCDPVDCSMPGSSVHGILQERILEWFAMPSSRVSSQPRNLTSVSLFLWHQKADSLPSKPPGKPHMHTAAAAAAVKSLQSCPTLCDPIDSSPPGSPVPGILQARTQEWVAIFFSNA